MIFLVSGSSSFAGNLSFSFFGVMWFGKFSSWYLSLSFSSGISFSMVMSFSWIFLGIRLNQFSSLSTGNGTSYHFRCGVDSYLRGFRVSVSLFPPFPASMSFVFSIVFSSFSTIMDSPMG